MLYQQKLDQRTRANLSQCFCLLEHCNLMTRLGNSDGSSDASKSATNDGDDTDGLRVFNHLA